MRIRTMAAATLAAAGLSVGVTGAASAAPAEEPLPPGEPVVVTCVDGTAVVRPATEEERRKIEEVRARVAEEPVRKHRGEGEGHGKRVVVSRDGKPVDKASVACAAGKPAAALPARPPAQP